MNYDMHPPQIETIRARLEREHYGPEVIVTIRTLLNRIDLLEGQLRQASEGRIDDH